MTNEELAKFKGMLEDTKNDLEKRLKKMNVVDFGHDVDSLEEESDETEEMATTDALTTTFIGRLDDVNAALEKIEKGTYGKCENCGNELSIEMLEADPESKLCKDCKAKNG